MEDEKVDDQIKVSISKKKTQIILIVAVAIIILLLIGILIWRNQQLKQAKEQVDAATPTSTSTLTADSSDMQSLVVIKGASVVPTPTATASQSSQDVIFSQVKTAATNFMNAYIDRSLAEAQPYMTSDFYNSTNQEDFAGVSSPSRDHYQFTSEVTAGADVYQIDVTVYLKLNGADSGSNNFRLNLLPGSSNDQYLVDAMNAI